MTLVIFKDQYRRHGYGSWAFAIFIKYLKEQHLVKQLIVRIETENDISISFWQKLGFRESQIIDNVMTLHMDLDDYIRNSMD